MKRFCIFKKDFVFSAMHVITASVLVQTRLRPFRVWQACSPCARVGFQVFLPQSKDCKLAVDVRRIECFKCAE